MTHILIADDDSDVRETLQLLLEDAGYATLTAKEGHQVLELVQRYPSPLVVLLDIGLPKVDGLSILRTIAGMDGQMAPHKRAYVLMTGHTPALYMPYGALLAQLHVHVLPKPFHIDYSLAVVADAAAFL
jgi:CheY-like chemotaxis protein